ncbi:TNR16 factor, partial [Columbina picui]|nr:TNR16 factor [Columbina picui]
AEGHVPALLSPQRPAWGSKDKCFSKMYTASGECCRACNLGEGVVQPCGLNQTVCEPCLDSVTYSDTVSATEPCKPCTQCVGLQSMSAPCVESDDAVCRCAYGYYQDEASGSCRECRVCEVGFGLMFPCQDSQDTVCEECPEGTFSSEANFVDPCLPCTTCEENEVLVKECTPTSDAECRAQHGRTGQRVPAGGTLPWALQGSRAQHPQSSIKLIRSLCCGVVNQRLQENTSCWERWSQERAVKAQTCSQPGGHCWGSPPRCRHWRSPPCSCPHRWNSCKQNKQGANNHPVNQTPSPEGEKLHSDSGISVDSQSLHDQQPPGPGTQGPGRDCGGCGGPGAPGAGAHAASSLAAPRADGSPYASLPAGKQDEVEKLLGSAAEETWRQLAGELGYKEDVIAGFTREEAPARALLADWATKESATLDVLLAALRKIQRGDIAESLDSESTATSPV